MRESIHADSVPILGNYKKKQKKKTCEYKYDDNLATWDNRHRKKTIRIPLWYCLGVPIQREERTNRQWQESLMYF